MILVLVTRTNMTTFMQYWDINYTIITMMDNSQSNHTNKTMQTWVGYIQRWYWFVRIYMHVYHPVHSCIFIEFYSSLHYIMMAWCRTAVSSLLKHWRYCGQAQGHRCVFLHLLNSSPPGKKKMADIWADDNFRCIFLNENDKIPIRISLKFVPRRPIDITPALVQVMAWRRTGDKPLPGTMLTQFTDAYMRH